MGALAAGGSPSGKQTLPKEGVLVTFGQRGASFALQDVVVGSLYPGRVWDRPTIFPVDSPQSPRSSGNVTKNILTWGIDGLFLPQKQDEAPSHLLNWKIDFAVSTEI